MRWLLVKDLQILRRSPAQLLLLVVYPVLLAVLVGFALTRGPDQSKVALFNAAPPGTTLGIEKAKLSGSQIRAELCERVECVDADSRREAMDMVAAGTATAAVILPEGLAAQIRSLTTIAPQRPSIEIIVNGSDTLENQVVDDRIESMLAQANLLIAKKLATGAVGYLDLLGKGGQIDLLGQRAHVLGLEKAARLLREVRADLPAGSARGKLDDSLRFARLAAANLDLAEPMLRAIAQPIEADKVEVGGKAPSLDTFAIAATAALALMFVTVLLVAGSLALEREENTFTRLTGGLAGRTKILVAKLELGTVVGFGVILILLTAMTVFLPIQWSRAPLWLSAVAVAALAFAAVGAALGAVTREVRAASLGAIMLCLPLALLSLIPADAVGSLIRTVITVATALFPFRPALDAIGSGLELSGGGIGLNLAHLLILTAAYGAVARFALRRF